MNNYITLSNKTRMPVLGLGTCRSSRNKISQVIKSAITNYNYRHIDCASIYRNEKEIGHAFHKLLTSKAVKREELFITSKLWNTNHNPKYVEKACRKTLKDLQLIHLDLYLMHWGVAFPHGNNLEPIGKDGFVITENISIQQTWQAMEKLVKKGLVKSIGVANFTAPMLVDLLTYAKVKPVINQIEIHPYNSQAELVKYCHKKGIAVTAYSPLGSFGNIQSKPIADKIVLAIAKSHKKSPAQVLIRWSLQRGLIAIPKTENPKRLAENINVFNFELSKTEMEQINQLNKNLRFVDPTTWWSIPYFK